jgi:hypothetical protein
MRSFVGVMLIVGMFGCTSEVQLKEAPVSVLGTVSRSGQPLSGMVMIFQPLDDGHVREFPIGKNGTFEGKLVSGEYAYYVAKPTVRRSAAQSLSSLSPKYFEADLSRTVTVEPGNQIAIALD